MERFLKIDKSIFILDTTCHNKVTVSSCACRSGRLGSACLVLCHHSEFIVTIVCRKSERVERLSDGITDILPLVGSHRPHLEVVVADGAASVI